MMQIRRATLTDLDAIESLWMEMALFHQQVDPYFTIIPEAEDNHRNFMTGLLQDQVKRVFVADNGDQILGYLVAEINAYPPIYLHKNYGYIGAISVTTAARRQGIGHQLLAAALDWFRAEGLQRVECSVAVENPVSQGFWKRAGFRGFMEKHVLEIKEA
jgi:ribosomal protein S18 acetylase RimI-like enzyme